MNNDLMFPKNAELDYSCYVNTSPVNNKIMKGLV